MRPGISPMDPRCLTPQGEIPQNPQTHFFSPPILKGKITLNPFPATSGEPRGRIFVENGFFLHSKSAWLSHFPEKLGLGDAFFKK